MAFRMIHTADWHVCGKHLEDARACLAHLTTEAHRAHIENHLDLIVIPGDIYNSRQIQQETEAARLAMSTIKDLAEIAPVVVLTGTPSHDGNAPLALRNIRGRHPVLVIDKPGQWVMYHRNGEIIFTHILTSIQSKGEPINDIAEPLAIISGTPAFTKQFFDTDADTKTSDKNIADSLGGIFAGFGAGVEAFSVVNPKHTPLPHVHLGHCSIGSAYIHPGQPMIGKDIEISLDHLDMAKATINCFGHIHAGQKVGQNSFYSGSLFSTDFGEIEEKGFYLHTLGRGAADEWMIAESQFLPTPSPKLVKINIDLIRLAIDMAKESVPEEEITRHIIEWCDEEIDPTHAERTVARMEIKTYQDETHLIAVDTIEGYFKDAHVRSFELVIKRVPRPNVRSARLLEVDRLRDKVMARCDIIEGQPEAIIPHREATLDLADELEDTPGDVLINGIIKELNA